MIRQILIAGVFVFIAANAEAASFDCKKAKTEVEEIICSDWDLSKTDEKVAQAYHDALSKLSSEGQRILRDNQRRWLKTLPKGCYYAPDNLWKCVDRAYQERLRDLQSVAVPIGPFLFSRVDFYSTVLNVGEDGIPHTFNYHIAYPRIDSPQTAEARKWNLAKQKPDFSPSAQDSTSGCEGGSRNIGYDIEQTGKTSLFFRFWSSDYCAPMAHGQEEVSFANIDVTRGLEPLTAHDLFDQDSDWLGFLVRRSVRELPDEASEDMLESVVKDSSSWMIEKERLTINFPHYTVAGYPSYSVIASWKILRPYLRPDAPIPQ